MDGDETSRPGINRSSPDVNPWKDLDVQIFVTLMDWP